MNSNWKEIKSSCKTYQQTDDEPYLIHVIKTGFKDRYMVVYEDAFNIETGDIIISLTSQELLEKFGI